jgi:hypothetical protein
MKDLPMNHRQIQHSFKSISKVWGIWPGPGKTMDFIGSIDRVVGKLLAPSSVYIQDGAMRASDKWG